MFVEWKKDLECMSKREVKIFKIDVKNKKLYEGKVIFDEHGDVWGVHMEKDCPIFKPMLTVPKDRKHWTNLIV